jgi:hypothetical protein
MLEEDDNVVDKSYTEARKKLSHGKQAGATIIW